MMVNFGFLLRYFPDTESERGGELNVVQGSSSLIFLNSEEGYYQRSSSRAGMER